MSLIRWFETEDRLVLELDLVREASKRTEIIQQKMKEAKFRQKNHIDMIGGGKA